MEIMKKASIDAPSDLLEAPDEEDNHAYNMEVNKDIEYLKLKYFDECDDV